jgi:hypothetical protein
MELMQEEKKGGMREKGKNEEEQRGSEMTGKRTSCSSKLLAGAALVTLSKAKDPPISRRFFATLGMTSSFSLPVFPRFPFFLFYTDLSDLAGRFPSCGGGKTSIAQPATAE